MKRDCNGFFQWTDTILGRDALTAFFFWSAWAAATDRPGAPITRTARGHTARPLRADRWEIACFVLVGVAAFVRVLVPVAMPPATLHAILASAVCWSAGFGLFAVRYWPVLTRPRLDGKPD